MSLHLPCDTRVRAPLQKEGILLLLGSLLLKSGSQLNVPGFEVVCFFFWSWIPASSHLEQRIQKKWAKIMAMFIRKSKSKDWERICLCGVSLSRENHESKDKVDTCLGSREGCGGKLYQQSLHAVHLSLYAAKSPGNLWELLHLAPERWCWYPCLRLMSGLGFVLKTWESSCKKSRCGALRTILHMRWRS